jgi:hypothetical protein
LVAQGEEASSFRISTLDPNALTLGPNPLDVHLSAGTESRRSEPLREIDRDEFQEIFRFEVSNFGDLAAVKGRAFTYIVDLESNEILIRLTCDASSYWCPTGPILFGENGRVFVCHSHQVETGDIGTTINVWDIDSDGAMPIADFEVHVGDLGVSLIAANDRGSVIVVGRSSSSLGCCRTFVIAVASGKIQKTLDGVPKEVRGFVKNEGYQLVSQNAFRLSGANVDWFWLTKGSKATLFHIGDEDVLRATMETTFPAGIDLSSGSTELSADGEFAMIQTDDGYRVVDRFGATRIEEVKFPASLFTAAEGITYFLENYSDGKGGRLDISRMTPR